MADILELKNIKWKPQAYRIAGQTLESLKKDVKEIYKKEGEKGLDKLPGIGSRLAKKISQYIKTGKIKEYEKLKKSLPKGLYEMMNIPGIGVKRAKLFYRKKGIKSVKELKKAIKKHKLIGLPGFKKRAEEKVSEGISILKGQKGRIPLKQAEKISNLVLRSLRKLRAVKRAVAAGSLRRKKSTIRDIDLVVETTKSKEVVDKFVKMSFVKKVLGKGAEKGIIISKQGMQVDIRIAKPEYFGACLLYFTGDKQHNIWLRKKAIKRGWKLSEYGLFEGKKRIAGKTESSIYKKLSVKMPKPEMRIGETE